MKFREIQGYRARLVPLVPEHVKELFECARNADIWEHLPIKIETLEQMECFIHDALKNKEHGDEFPYSIIDRHTGKFVGMTRYLRISKLHRNLNVGWTWYNPGVWGSAFNTECKYLLLNQAFEDWKACRVELITTTNHVRSQRAIEKLGATREGILRKKYNGTDYVVFSIIDDDWPEVKHNLEGRLREANYDLLVDKEPR